MNETVHIPAILDRLSQSVARGDAGAVWSDFDTMLTPLGFRSVHYESGMPGGGRAEPCLKAQASAGPAFGDLVCPDFMRAVQQEPETYAAEDFVRHCETTVLPLTFDTGSRVGDPSSPLQQVKNLARDFAVTGGIVVPLRGFADRTFGNVTYILDTHTPFEPSASLVAEVTALAHTIHGALMQLRHPITKSAQVYTPLSAQEASCLSWVAQGLSTKRLAHRMGLSDATANEYIRNACRKLRATTRAEAAAKAVALGLIQL